MVFKIRISFLLILISIILVGCQQEDVDSLLKDNTEFIILNGALPEPNKGEVQTKFKEPDFITEYGFNSNVIIGNNVSIAALVSFDSIVHNISNDAEFKNWIEINTDAIAREISENRNSGLSCFVRTDILILPKLLYSTLNDQIVENGKISIDKPIVKEIIRITIDEIFTKFDLDGLIVRTGEIYLNRLPYHYGENIIRNSKDYITLINILREEICVKRDKKLLFRTWGNDGFHTSSSIYLDVTNKISPHKNLLFSVKHVSGDYFRTLSFNETIGLGNHFQIVEFQSQREYEGKGAHPNYIAKGVLTGFMESSSNLNSLIQKGKIGGMYIWSRGGGWAGPLIENELWCDLNTYVISQYIKNKGNKEEEEIFNDFCKMIGINDSYSISNFRKLCLLTEKAVLLGQYSNLYPINVIWTRDHCFGGIDQLASTFDNVIKINKINLAISEKESAVKLWEEIVFLSNNINSSNKEVTDFIKTSSLYGLYKYSIIKEGFTIMLLGYSGEKGRIFRKKEIVDAIILYDQYWNDFKKLKENYSNCPTLYYPYSFSYANDKNDYLSNIGMKTSVDKYRNALID